MPLEPSNVSVGVVFRPQFAPERIADAAKAADAAGLDELWLWEDCFLAGGISAATIALANSRGLKVGVGVLPVPMRNVAVTAMVIATLARAYPGRVRIGVGHGVQDWMAQIGEKVASPMTLLREYVTVLLALLRGERVTFDGRYVQLTDVCLDWPPDPETELLLAATGPRTLSLSGELGSGTVITGGTTPDSVRESRQHILTGIAKRSEPKPHSTVVYVVCATEPDARARCAMSSGTGSTTPPKISVHTARRKTSPRRRRGGSTPGPTLLCFSPRPMRTSQHSSVSSEIKFSR